MKRFAVISLLVFLVPAISFAQDFSSRTDSSEIQRYDDFQAQVSQVNQPSLAPVLNNLLGTLGCHPRGELLNSLQIANFTAYRRAHFVGVLRKGQSLEIEFNICADKAVKTDPSFWLEIKTRDLSNIGESSQFNRNTDAKISMFVDGKELALVGPVYRNNGYKRALRELGMNPLPAGRYKLIIKAEAADVGIGYVTLYYASSNY